MMKEQFKGALQNALAIAGFLDIAVDMDKICIYSVYRNDKLNDFVNPASLRFQMHERGAEKLPAGCQDWNEKTIELKFLGRDRFEHRKIPLNVEDGTGVMEF